MHRNDDPEAIERIAERTPLISVVLPSFAAQNETSDRRPNRDRLIIVS